MLVPILKIGNILDDEEYETMILASIVKMFAVPDRAIRLSLLENLSLFIDRLDNKVVNDKVFPNVVRIPTIYLAQLQFKIIKITILI